MTQRLRYLVSALLISFGLSSAGAEEPKLKIDMPGEVAKLVITPDGNTVVVGFVDTLSNSVRTWDLGTGKLKSKLPVEGIYAMQLAADGNTLALSTGKTIELWDLKTEKRTVQSLKETPGHT
jgi:WD40 repeat protein